MEFVFVMPGRIRGSYVRALGLAMNIGSAYHNHIASGYEETGDITVICSMNKSQLVCDRVL